jgi:predicted Fe-Mo cluster-binding NifX family protein
MKIAVASEGKMVSGHFGHCEGFTIYEVADNKIEGKGFTQNPGHRPGYLPVFLKEKGVNAIISGGMGETAQQLFTENGIKVVVGAEGESDAIVEKYLNGHLLSTESVCHEHQYEGHCNE